MSIKEISPVGWRFPLLRHLQFSTSWLEVPIIEVMVLLNQLCWSNEGN